MCGIVGIWEWNTKTISDTGFDRLVDTLTYRGPGSRGTWQDEKMGVRLGHRRLAVFDLTDRGAQPMSYAGERYWITFNGEIYNYLELREELSRLGHTFRSTGDTEVLLAAYAQWGQACQLKFNGIWALAIWDRKTQQLFLSRDNFGIKPLHYIRTDQYFAFASEMKAFLALPQFQVNFDEDLITETLTNINGLEATEHCLLRGVKRLPAGHCMVVQVGKQPMAQCWWNTLDHLPTDIPKSFADQTERFKELFTNACRIRLRGDLPVITNLSGGLDSSSITAVTAMLLRRQGMPSEQQRAFVACFPGTNQDETEYAKAVAEFHHITPVYHTIGITPQVQNMLDTIMWHHEDIYWVLPLGPWLIYHSMGQEQGIVTLDGGGGDEILAGHHFYLLDMIQHALRSGQWKLVRDLQTTVAHMAGSSPVQYRLPYLAKRQLLGIASVQKRIVPFIGKYTPALPQYFLRRSPRHYRLRYEWDMPAFQTLTPLQRSQYIWMHYTGLPTIARVYDRGAAAHAVAVRTPFLDWRLATYGLALPDNSKVQHGYTKYILREAMQGMLPETVRLRTSKVGFTSPMDKWFAGPLRAWLLQTIEDPTFVHSTIWDGLALQQYVQRRVQAQDWSAVAALWPFFNMHHVLRLFREKSQV